MGKFIVVGALIVLGLFAVLMINNNSTKVKPLIENSTINLSPVPPSPSPVIINSMTEQTQATSAIIKTEKGDIEISFYTSDAPNTVANFVNKAKNAFYNNLIFHRVEDWVVQGGDPLGNGTGGGSVPVEFNNKPFIVGSVGIASRGDGKVQNDAQFFITKKDSQFLNGQYTNFGIVTKGMDVVEKIAIGDKILQIIIN